MYFMRFALTTKFNQTFTSKYMASFTDITWNWLQLCSKRKYGSTVYTTEFIHSGAFQPCKSLQGKTFWGCNTELNWNVPHLAACLDWFVTSVADWVVPGFWVFIPKSEGDLWANCWAKTLFFFPNLHDVTCEILEATFRNNIFLYISWLLSTKF